MSQTTFWCDDRVRVPPGDPSNIDVPLDLGEVKLNLPNRPPVGFSTSKTTGDIREH
ncbi:MAG TPA: hypothetical protein VN541_13385 [Tepidisphaeraceae bacterium]|nr:hypothetical protein [Tepidisphaeraceae bacterium]